MYFTCDPFLVFDFLIYNCFDVSMCPAVLCECLSDFVIFVFFLVFFNVRDLDCEERGDGLNWLTWGKSFFFYFHFVRFVNVSVSNFI